jgi:hypothetical protein
MNAPYVPSFQQIQLAFQTILDNRRHAQNTVRFSKLKALLLILVAMVLTAAAQGQPRQVRGDSAITIGIAAKVLPWITILVAPLAMMPTRMHVPGVNDRAASWQLGLGANEYQSMMSLLQSEADALKRDLQAADLHCVLAFIPKTAAFLQMIAAGLYAAM